MESEKAKENTAESADVLHVVSEGDEDNTLRSVCSTNETLDDK